ncbi:MAG: chemotaxis protein CheA [Methylophilaceae bacterium]|nr:chemotaxis protein CheA [Methylophilaceae bacterium]
MTIDMSQFYEVFFDEAEELLAEAERLLLGINIDDPDIEELNAIFRAAHSIKGGAATFGFMDMTEITHVLENLLDKIRKSELALTAEHVDAFLAAKDVLKMMVDGHRLATEVDQDQVADVKMQLNALSDKSGDKSVLVLSVPVAATPAPVTTPVMAEPVAAAPVAATPPAPLNEPLAALDENGLRHFSIEFAEVSEKDVANLQEELGLLGTVDSAKHSNGRYLFTLSTDSTPADIISICSFVVDTDSLVIRNMQTAEAPVVATPLVEAPVAAASAANAPASTLANTHGKVEIHEEVGYGLFAMPGEDNVEEGYGFFAPFTPHPDAVVTQLIGDDTPAATPVEAVETTAAATPVVSTEKVNLGRRETDKPPAGTETTSIRVGIEKVDQLINLVGELVITQAMIEQRSSTLDPVLYEKLINSISLLTRNTRDLQESVMSIRMMPMDFVFSRFPRMVRDLAGKLNKKVEFVTVGATTELDKGLIERIVDPLTHLVRNSVDHGIETPAQRKAAGKDEQGKLTLAASHKGGSIVIEVTDDGAGLNREKLLAKAAKNGLPVSENMTDTEVYALIFAPGFSTAEVVTDVSGRGVGMDVVKRNITAMGGTVEIRSALGYGTTISIALPLTLAILDGMSVSLGENTYVVPLNLIVETMQPRMEDIKTVTNEGLMVHVRGEYLPIIPLYALFKQDTEITHPTEGVLVIIEAEGKKSALFVDTLVGQQQVVIKSLETNFKKIQGVSGATIMGDGSVALILDIPAVIKMGSSNKTQGALQ